MTSHRTVRLLPLLLALASGCAQSGSMFSRGTTTGSLKASVSQLEYENQQLRRKTASLEKENRDIENRLVQEESLNGELTARLDDARSLLGQRGGSLSGTDVDPGPGRTGKTLPAGRSSRKGRKPPVAQIPGRIDTVPAGQDESEPRVNDSSTGSGWKGDPGPQSYHPDPRLWLPVARGTTEPSTRK